MLSTCWNMLSTCWNSSNLIYVITWKVRVVVLSTSAKHLKLWKVASAVIRFKSEIILDGKYKNFLYDHFINYNHSIENVNLNKVTPVEILTKQPGESKYEIKNADFRPNSTGSSDCRHHFPLALMTKYSNKGAYHPFAPTFTSSHWNQMFAESVDLTVCVAMVFRGENKDWIGPWMTFCELPTITVGMSFYMHSLLFRYLDWNQSWMVQIAEVYAIQINLNSKWLWHTTASSKNTVYQH